MTEPWRVRVTWLTGAGGMSAVQEAIGQRQRGLLRLIRWSPRGGSWRDRPPRLTPRWPLLTMRTSLIVYVLGILACDLGLIGWTLAHTQLRAGHLVLFAALLAAAVLITRLDP